MHASPAEARRANLPLARRWPIGAEVLAGGGVSFRVWATRPKRVELVLISPKSAQVTDRIDLVRDDEGYFSGVCAAAGAGTHYGFCLDGDAKVYPDPMSRFQPQGPHGPSQVIDPAEFRWTDDKWRGVSRRGQVHYELHIGTFTPVGTWKSATEQLPELADLGITIIEVMPVAEFPGQFGWGYDGVNLFAPTRLYGTPDDFRSFVNRAHALGLGVILDVVYNHIGPDGNYLPVFSPEYFTKQYQTDWGEAINFAGPGSKAVREYFLTNAAYWISEFHLDGFRMDATQNIYDENQDHILAGVTRAVRQAAGSRGTIVIAENETQNVRHVQAAELGGFAMDGMWNDDFHHAAQVVLSGHREAYYSDYNGAPQEFVSAIKHGFLYQGQRSAWQKNRRGTPAAGLPREIFVNFLQNHDQVANSGEGLRCHALGSPGRFRAMTALLLLGPGTPLLFQGQEFASSSPFLFFADHVPELARLVAEGRKKFLAQFPSLAVAEVQARLADPAERSTFERCRLDFSERAQHAAIYRLHRDLLQLRRDDAVFQTQGDHGIDGAVLGEEAFVLRFFGNPTDDRLMLVNFGSDLLLKPSPQPLLAPPHGAAWSILWSSEDPLYGGAGSPPVETDEGWRLPGQAAVVLQPVDEKH